jgi:hypothetical protein
MPVIARTGAMLVIGHKAPMETSAIACRIESHNQRRKAVKLKQVSGPQRCRPHAIPACEPTVRSSSFGDLIPYSAVPA